ncbi:DUF4190 domain-containing protein [Salinibacterium sp. NSLL150]|uniref:DUF4190 domain-containing protein n=1 Tax=unclassified Salinibacterium TaxID=2632331 RepID=UPI0018CFCF96|nr:MULTISPECIES: DUF4190 domain-containing protein [unclassified Salinibacterium]MBH0098282.1 DUF4190 domain-containing protein [Salinibacterium sp. NSLL35]MBH0101037.1 DUF4190 domain-containing protein [Salinibacterium sp. NSLL150]MBH0103796.1 DUF4190 domain-containing protein [Salinibacterium sp. NSLL16]MBH0106557.1 DUF4190 domain-containing protein [Salinibacterium sp. NSLL17]MBH0109678.1 DUF4190 domain-containing protein [Salinibacterium sp. NG22]
MSEPTPYAASPAGAPVAKWNVLSIISLVTSVLGLSLVGIILGHISLSQIKKTGEQGNVLAIIGLVLGYLGFVVFLFLAIGFVVTLGAVGTSY